MGSIDPLRIVPVRSRYQSQASLHQVILMLNSLTLLPKSIDPEGVDDLLSKIIPSMKQAKGLLELKISEGPLMSPGGPPSYSKVIEASWESLEDIMAWAQTSAAQDDKDFLLESGAILLFYEVEDL